ncbi:C-C motif chemokine 20-like [Eucyclogobius newberryi]|uniref:C-C motif chemokine 20-like n=1 Tax=Eucyclogobius newberryi TaxID=166745 RepID=UPI003B5C6D2F
MASGNFCLMALCSLALLSHLIVPAQSWSCCLKYRSTERPLPCKRLLAYSIQTMKQNCDINAVIFHQTNGRFVCADPLAPQTQRGMKCVNQRRQQVKSVMKKH